MNRTAPGRLNPADQMLELLEIVFQIVALCAWLVALPILLVFLTPCFIVAAIRGREPFWPELKRRCKTFFSKWMDALPIR